MKLDIGTLVNDNKAIVIFVVFVLLFLYLAFLTNVYIPFNKNKKYIKMEMSRSSGKEYLYWKKELKKLYLSCIPFIGKRLK